MYGADTIVTALSLEASARRYLEPEVPTGVIESTSEYQMQQTEIDEFLLGWETARRARNTAFLQNAKYNAASRHPSRCRWCSPARKTPLQISRHLNLPPRYVSTASGDSQTYTNVTAERRELVSCRYSRTYPRSMAASVHVGSERITARQVVRFDVDAFLRPTPQERADIYQSSCLSALPPRSEARENEAGTSRRHPHLMEVTQ